MSKLSPLNKSRLALAISQALILPIANANVITVDSANDDNSASACTLREAIISANTDGMSSGGCASGSGSDTINFSAGLAGSTIGLALGPLSVSSIIEITTPNQSQITIDAGNASRVMELTNAVVTINRLTITNGSAVANGGGLKLDNSTLTLNNSTISNNTAGSRGGGVYLAGSQITLNNSSISGNSSGGNGGGLLAYSSSTVNLSNSVISNNHAASNAGGLMVNLTSRLYLDHTTVANNTAGVFGGGGISLSNSPNSVIDTSTLSGNQANTDGAGMNINASIVEIRLSTLSGNSAVLRGSAIWVESYSSLTVTNSTLADNSAGRYAALYFKSSSAVLSNTTIANNQSTAKSSGLQAFNSTISMHNVLLADNLGGEEDCRKDINSTITNGGGNLVEDDNNCGVFAIEGQDPKLAPLDDNGGETQTLALYTGSPAIDAGSGVCPATDQRGIARPIGAGCDIGAFEGRLDKTSFFVIPTKNGKTVLFGL